MTLVEPREQLWEVERAHGGDILGAHATINEAIIYARKRGDTSWPQEYSLIDVARWQMKNRLIVARDRHQLVIGMMVLSAHEFEHGESILNDRIRSLLASNLGVAQEHHGAGVAQQLLDFGSDWAAEVGAEELVIHVNPHATRLLGYYAGLGFTETGSAAKTMVVSPDGSVSLPAVEMRRSASVPVE